MDASVYSRPNKPKTIQVRDRRFQEPVPAPESIPEPVIVDRHTECHVTPESVSGRMVGYLEIAEDDNVLEPEFGTGNLINAVLKAGIDARQVTGVERHQALYSATARRFAGQSLILVNQCFLDWSENQSLLYSKVLMNPPFRQVRKHMKAAHSLLAADGVLVALVPTTYHHDRMTVLETLEQDTFAYAKVRTKIIVIRN
jgi:phospholipid N-methyltransferase